ncbi:NAD(P)(+) transhydrogenase (Re/Si-specific) subunit alpha, partial [Ancylobacter sp. GSK1Z-4-2]|nr:NAD(P)(+) transhydrogenase (Re/Si-specific) subunit alpha [Ancylobacter mangrovi]MCS0504957.1 NAD(P)(+) transhydrogenase (Re/Si-specific) subunit alpha [Ancylobacter mangrovi]
MRLAIVKEDPSVDPRVAGSPDTVKRYVGLGADVVVSSGAGSASGVGDGEYEGAGASVVAD